MGETWDLDRVTKEWTARGLSRRSLLKVLASGASLTAVASLLGPGAAAAQGNATTAGGQANVFWAAKPQTLSPLFSTSGNEQQVERLMFGALVKMSNKLVPTPDLAASVDVTPDAKTYTFHLHNNITFTDGQPLTAKDVVFTLERAIDKRTGSIWTGRLINIAGAKAYSTQQAASVSGIETPDDYTVRLTMQNPDAAFLVTLGNFSGLGILPAHVLQNVPPDQLQKDPFSLNPNVSAGAFKFTQYATDQYLQLDRNDKYFGGTVPLDRIFMRLVTQDVSLAQLQTGEIDLTAVPVQELAQVQKMTGVTVAAVPSPSMDFLALNLERAFFKDVRVRQAMMYAIDRAGIVKTVLGGQGAVVNSPIFGPDWMGVPEGLEQYPYSPDQAKKLLADANWNKDQKVQIMHLPGTKYKDAAVAIMQEELTQVGIKASIFQVDVAELNQRYTQTGDFDIFYNSGGVFRADPNVSSAYFNTANFTPNGGNASHYSNPQVDQLFTEGVGTTDLAKRKQIYTQIAKILNQEVPWIYLFSPNSIYGYRNRLHGFAPPSYIDNKLWNAETWSVSS